MEMKFNLFDTSEANRSLNVIEQYASDVRSFSSQYGSEISISYTAYNIIGKPSKYPAYGDFPQTFVMRTYGKWWDEAPSRRIPIMLQNNRDVRSQDYIDITFEHKIIPRHVNIYETYHPGSVVRIWASDGEDKWSLLWEGRPEIKEHVPSIFSPPIKEIDFYTNLLRLEFDHSHLDYYTEIDAVSMKGLLKNVGNESSTTATNNENESASGSSRSNPEKNKSKIFLKFLNEDYSNFVSALEPPVIKSNDTAKSNNGAFAILPDESVLKIFSYLDLVSLSRCAVVNRHFNSLATDQLLYASLNLKVMTNAYNHVTASLPLVFHSAHRLNFPGDEEIISILTEGLHIPYWHLINANTLNILSLRCKYLQKLDLSWCGSFPSSISPNIFCEFIETCGKSLTHIRLDCCQFVCNCCIKTISHICRNLTELTLQNCTGISECGFSHLSSLKTIERLDLYRTLIEATSLKEILKSSPHLKHINLGSCRRISTMDEIAQILGTYNKELISVDFWKTYSLTPIGIKYLSQCSLLQEIDIGWCLGVSIPGDCFLSLAMGCPRLRKLFMGTLRGINDRDLYPFIYNCPDLEQIDLLGNRGIASEVCLNILKSCKRLKFLDVSFCEQINDTEVQEWKKKFPSVDIKRSFQSEPECTCAFSNHY